MNAHAHSSRFMPARRTASFLGQLTAKLCFVAFLGIFMVGCTMGTLMTATPLEEGAMEINLQPSLQIPVNLNND